LSYARPKVISDFRFRIARQGTWIVSFFPVQAAIRNPKSSVVVRGGHELSQKPPEHARFFTGGTKCSTPNPVFAAPPADTTPGTDAKQAELPPDVVELARRLAAMPPDVKAAIVRALGRE